MLDFGQFDFGQFDFGQLAEIELAEVEIGRSRNWPKSKLAEVEQMVFALLHLFSCSYSSLSSFCGCCVSVFVPKNLN